VDEQAYIGRRANLGHRHLNTLHSRMCLGLDLLAMGKYAESVQTLTEASTDLAETLGPARPLTLLASTLLAWALGRAGRQTEALTLARDTHARYAEKYDAHHPSALLCGLTLAAALSANGAANHVEAVRMARFAVAGFEDIYGPRHPSALAAVNNTAVYELRAGNSDEAKAMLERAAEGLIDRLGAAHPNSAATTANLATCAALAGRLNDAERLERLTLANLTASLGPDHPDTLTVTHNLAITLRALGRRREARALSAASRRTRLDLELPPMPL
jgi:hypothetical protein